MWSWLMRILENFAEGEDIPSFDRVHNIFFYLCGVLYDY